MMTVVAVAAACELALRFGSERLSSDITHIRSIPAVAAALKARDGERLLVLGNSLTREGVDIETVRRELECGSTRVSAESVHPDDLAILDWYYIFRNNFRGENALDWLVIPFARGQLYDSNPIHAERIAAYFGGWANAAEMLRFDLASLDDRIGYLLACALHLFSESDRVRVRVLSAVVPDYRQTARRLNAAVQRERLGPVTARRQSYARLARLLRLCRQRNVRVALVAMPQGEVYGLDRGLQAVLAQNGGELLDMRNTKELSAADFADGMHLTPSGARVFSRILGGELRKRVCESAPGVEKPAAGGPGDAAARTPAGISEAVPEHGIPAYETSRSRDLEDGQQHGNSTLGNACAS